MEAHDLKAYYQNNKELWDSSKENLKKEDISRALIFITNKNDLLTPIIQNDFKDFTFLNEEEIKKNISKIWKNKNEYISNSPDPLFQIHFHLYIPHEKAILLITADEKAQKGFFKKLTGSIDVELDYFWWENESFSPISTKDDRFKELIIKNIYQEALEIFYAKTEYKKVEALLVKCLEIAKDDVASLVLMGRCKLFLSQFEAAEDIFNQAVTIEPSNYRALQGLATAQLEIFKINPRKEHLSWVDAAEKNCDEGLKLYPESYDLLNLKGGISLIRSDQEKALAFFLKATEANPKEMSAWLNAGMAYMAANNFALANDQLTKALKIQPHNEQVVYRKMQCMFEMNLPEAKDFYDLWATKKPNTPWILEIQAAYLTEIPEGL